MSITFIRWMLICWP